jgi:hypothetical protein
MQAIQYRDMSITGPQRSSARATACVGSAATRISAQTSASVCQLM